MLSLKQQAFELFNKNKNILIALPQNHSVDSLASGLALLLLAKDLGKNIDIVVQEPVADKLSFLPGLENIKLELTAVRDFIISIDTSQKKIKELHYETRDSVLKIYLASPDKLEQKDIKLEPGPFAYETIITLAVPDLEALGQLYEKSAELFFEKPILNIDSHSGNEYYGEVNLVEPTFSSCGEILTDFFLSFFPNQITPAIATCLLTAIMAETHSFQKTTVSPQTLNLASLLITQGAEREKIVQVLYKTKSLDYLRLWGKLLSRLEYQPEKNLAWIEVNPNEQTTAQDNQTVFSSILEDVYDFLPQLNAGAIFWSQEPELVTALVQSPRPDLLQKLTLEMGGSIKNHQAIFKIVGSDLGAAKTKLQDLINSLF